MSVFLRAVAGFGGGLLVLAVWASVIGTLLVQAQTRVYDWTTDGGDVQRSGWNQQEKTLTPGNIANPSSRSAGPGRAPLHRPA